MTDIIMTRNNAKGKLAWLVSKDAKHFYLAIQEKGWRKPVFKAFYAMGPEFFRVCKELRQ